MISIFHLSFKVYKSISQQHGQVAEAEAEVKSASSQVKLLKLQIEGEMQHNKKSKEKLMALHEDIEKNVNIVTMQLTYYICRVLATCLDRWPEHGT